MKSTAVLAFALVTLCVMECYVSGTKIYYEVIVRFIIIRFC